MVPAWLILVSLLIVLSWLYSRWTFTYWERKGISSPPALPFIGHLHQLMSMTAQRWDVVDEMYYKYKKSGLFGLYEALNPILLVTDPEIIKNIFVKDFDHFVDRRSFGPEQKDSYQNDMLSIKKGSEWKDLRAIMSPTFSSGKMRRMFPLVCKSSDALISSCLMDAEKNPCVDLKDKAGRFTMDTIASCAFGIECNSFKNDRPLFAQNADKIFSLPLKKKLKFFFGASFPKVFNALGFKVDQEEMFFFRDVVEETIRARENDQTRGDFLDLMLESQAENNNKLPTDSSHKHVLTKRVIVSQSILFLVAGYDTTASALSFTAHLLAKYPKHQERLRQELQQLTKEEGELTYQGVMEAKFLDACIQESLRMYPPALFVDRTCTKNYSIPGTNITLDRGCIVSCPLWSLHYDAEYWPNPRQYNPERFMPENKINIKPYTHIPFGLGPRNCLAMRFALMEVKVALAKLILAADVKIAPGCEEIELEVQPFLQRPKHGVPLLLTPRKQESIYIKQ